MEDSDLAYIRNKRMQELQQMQSQQKKQEEMRDQQENAMNGILNQVLDQRARARLSAIKLAKPDKGQQIEQIIIQMATTGQVGGKLNEDDLIKILERISEQSKKKQW